jgi:toxin ParE1/3/4
MRRLRLLSSARTDLVNILEYVTRQSGSVAIGRKFVSVLRDQCQHLARLPGTLGRSRPELGRDIRSFAFQGYMIFFRYRDGVFEVINIIEGHRDIDDIFRRETSEG